MGADKTPDHMRGLLIPDPRFTYAGAFSKTGSTLSQNTPRPGVPVALDNSDLIVETSGTQGTGTTKEYTLYTQNSGYPEDLGGTFLQHRTDDSGTYKYIGWEPPLTVSGIQRVEYTTDNWRNFDIVTAQDDTLIIAGVTHSSTFYAVWYKKPESSTWTRHTFAFDLEPGMSPAKGARPQDDSMAAAVEAGCNASPALVVLPSGRVLMFYWLQIAIEDTSTGPTTSISSWQIQAWFSDDSGASWAVYQDYCLVEPLRQLVDTRDGTNGRYYPGRLRAEYKDGQILMISSAFDTGSSTAQGAPAHPGNVYLQYASSSLGASFELVEKNEREANSTAAYDIAVSGGHFVISWLEFGGSGAVPYVGRLGSAYTPLSRSEGNVISGTYAKSFGELLTGSSGNAVGRADLAICAAPDGSMYLCGTRHGTGSPVHTRNSVAVLFSADSGITWQEMGGDYGTDNTSKDSTLTTTRFYDEPSAAGVMHRDTLFDLAMTWQRGRAVLACRFERTDATGDLYSSGHPDYAVTALYLGGYSNLTIGSIDAAISMTDRANWGRGYLPFAEPSDLALAWSTTTTGPETTKISAADGKPYFEIETGDGSGSAGNYYMTPIGADAEVNHTGARSASTSATVCAMRTYIEFACHVITNGEGSGSQIGVKIRNGTPSAGSVFSIRMWLSGTDKHISIFDERPLVPTSIHAGELTELSAGQIPEIRCCVVEKMIAVYYRAYDPDAEIRTWHKAYESETDDLSIGTLAGKYCQLTWGHMASGGATTANKSRWYKLQIGSHDGELAHSAVPRLNDWLNYDSPQNVGGRFFSTAPIYMRDGLKIAAKDGPAVKGDEWQINPRHDYPIEAVHTEVSPSPAKIWASNGTANPIELVWDIDANEVAFPMGATRALYLGNINFRSCILHGYDGSSWSQIAVIDAAKQVKFHKRGNTVTAHPTSVSSDQTGDTFWTFDSLTGSTFNFGNTSAGNVYSILGNSEGVFETGATKAPILLLDGNASAEATTGDGQIWVKDLCVVIPDLVTDTYQKIKIEIPTAVSGTAIANKTVSGNWEIGTVVWGHVAVFGRQYSNGHIRQIEANSEMFTSTGGQRRAIRRGPARRAVEFSWVDPVDISPLADANPSPDYVKNAGSGSRIVASTADTPFLMQGLISRLDGPVTPVVYLPSIAASPTTPFQIMDSNRMLYGRITTPAHRIENQVGEEWVGNGAGETVTATAIRIEEEL